MPTMTFQLDRFLAELARARRAGRISQRSVAAALGVHIKSIYRYEHGRLAPSDADLRTFAEIVGVEVPPGIRGRATRLKGAAGCGTEGGWHRHRRAREKPCEPCRLARNAAQAAWSRRRAERLTEAN